MHRGRFCRRAGAAGRARLLSAGAARDARQPSRRLRSRASLARRRFLDAGGQLKQTEKITISSWWAAASAVSRRLISIGQNTRTPASSSSTITTISAATPSATNFLSKADRAHQRRHAVDRQSAALQRRGRRFVEDAGHRSAGLRAKCSHSDFYPSLGLNRGIFLDRELLAPISWSPRRKALPGRKCSPTRRCRQKCEAISCASRKQRSTICRDFRPRRRRRASPR